MKISSLTLGGRESSDSLSRFQYGRQALIPALLFTGLKVSKSREL